MRKLINASHIAREIWFLTSLLLAIGTAIFQCCTEQPSFAMFLGVLAGVFIGALIFSLPAFIALHLSIKLIKRFIKPANCIYFLLLTNLLITSGYAILSALIFWGFNSSDLENLALLLIKHVAILFTASFITTLLILRRIESHFYDKPSTMISTNIFLINKTKNMETSSYNYSATGTSNNADNKILIKGVITGVLILVMLIPTFFISNLVTERSEMQKLTVKEVSNMWANSQTYSGPYLSIPYTVTEKDGAGKDVINKKHLLVLPDHSDVNGIVTTEQRQRSIYKVLLYKSTLNNKGDFSFKLPEDVDVNNLLLANAKICIGLSDLRGIEEKATINFNGTNYELQPGLPTTQIDSNGLSATVSLTLADIDKSLSFNTNLKIKGSQQLHFIPLSGNSQYALQLGNAKYSFDGNALPSENKIDNNNAAAKWSFNKANLPFSSVLKDFKADKNAMAFGVTMLQPADQYVKTMRSVKYALLFIGLTFSLFFIVELMQKKPLHPVQYVLVGLALVIFFSLLLSISEYVLFNTAYLIAASATILLITLYTKGHFNSWKIASLFSTVISCLYGFIFILISLEETSLLIGSIGLFIVLALVMYASRKINWYGMAQPQLETSVV